MSCGYASSFPTNTYCLVQYVHILSPIADRWTVGQDFAIQSWLVSQVLQSAQQCLCEDHSSRVVNTTAVGS